MIRGVCKFLNRDYSDDQISALAGHLSFDSLRKNKTVNNTNSENGEIQFIRKGLWLIEVVFYKGVFKKMLCNESALIYFLIPANTKKSYLVRVRRVAATKRC